MGRDHRLFGLITGIAAIAGLMVAPAAGAASPSPGSSGADIAARGVASHATPACQACHGANGQGQVDGNIPRLAGLGAGYIERQIELFASGARSQPVMAPIARGLTTAERTAVAAYYAALPTAADPAGAAAGDRTRGQTLAQTGRWSAKIPPCASCHGAAGQGVGSAVPPLSAQPAGYIEAALNSWRDGARTGDPLGLMTGIAKRMSPDEVRDVAAYYAQSPAGPAARSVKTGPRPK